ncbi:hypothetical protein [Arthrobacter sp. ISL-95]|uniref:hypothetical protein n=1 Tax=Arthrobacter sp. ISL-95 TaxID=2819116 RepID=UPI001BE62E5B|nr:hypothetical protein [Arthrobacter sp. ISL-95]MBT2587959.1 hypothetical protein [Arthrobacter sp. ISL-95]
MGNHVATSTFLEKIASTPWLRTLWQGFIVDALGAIGLGLLTILGTTDPTDPLFWTLAGALVAKSFATAIASWFTRLKKDAAKPEELTSD